MTQCVALLRNAQFSSHRLEEIGLQSDLPIGVFDSGIGGLTVASAIARELPHERIFYFGDMARCPYGDRTPDEVREFSHQVLDYLVRLGVKLAVVACNTATATALPELRKRFGIPVVGVVQPGARAAQRVTSGGRIGIIGTNVTIASGAYEQAIYDLNRGVSAYSLACPPFVPLVEQGRWSGTDVLQTVHQALQPLVASDIDTLILGCTHYPLLQDAISKVMGPEVRLISSAEETAVEVREILEVKRGLSVQRSGPNQYYTTGDGTRMAEVLTSWMGVANPEQYIHRVSIEALATSRM